jgi:hypothetical protein
MLHNFIPIHIHPRMCQTFSTIACLTMYIAHYRVHWGESGIWYNKQHRNITGINFLTYCVGWTLLLHVMDGKIRNGLLHSCLTFGK